MRNQVRTILGLDKKQDKLHILPIIWALAAAWIIYGGLAADTGPEEGATNVPISVNQISK